MSTRRICFVLLILASFATGYKIVAVGPPNGGFWANKFFFGPHEEVDRLPSPFEFILQRLQTLFSSYVHEDLSRPPTWDKPVYTLSPEDQVYFAALQGIDISTSRNPGTTTEKLFEIIKEDRYQLSATTLRPAIQSTTHNFDDFEYVDLDESAEQLFEVISTSNASLVHITPKTTTGGGKEEITEKYIDPNLELNLTISLGKDALSDGSVLGAPVSYAANQSSSAMQIVFIPARYIYGVIPPAPYYPHHQQTRGPLQFIGNWIDSSDWFPIEVNVPDVFSNIGSGVGNVAQTVGQLAQNMGAGIMTFTQNVGSGIQNFAQGIGQRVPFIAALVRPSTTPNEGQEVAPQMYMILVPERGYAGDPPLSQMESEILETFP